MSATDRLPSRCRQICFSLTLPHSVSPHHPSSLPSPQLAIILTSSARPPISSAKLLKTPRFPPFSSPGARAPHPHCPWACSLLYSPSTLSHQHRFGCKSGPMAPSRRLPITLQVSPVKAPQALVPADLFNPSHPMSSPPPLPYAPVAMACLPSTLAMTGPLWFSAPVSSSQRGSSRPPPRVEAALHYITTWHAVFTMSLSL